MDDIAFLATICMIRDIMITTVETLSAVSEIFWKNFCDLLSGNCCGIGAEIIYCDRSENR